jgi:ribosomal protein S18 acetylase RimI-like enzyme
VWAEEPYVRNFVFACVDPDHENRGLGTWMTRWGVQRLCERLVDAPTETRFAINAYPYTRNSGAIDLLTDEGFVYERIYYEMGIDLDGAPELSPLPEGIVLRTFDPEKDVERLFEAYLATFRDHFGYIERPREAAFSRWHHMIMEHSTFDPTLVTLAEHNGEVVGYSVCWPEENEPGSDGHIQHLGTVRAWRRKGLARALLTRAFASFHARGIQRVALGVDAANPTGALGLYEKAGMHVNSSTTSLTLVIREGSVPEDKA